MTVTWFITGTSSGFGRLLTERLLARGDRVAATLRRRRGDIGDLVTPLPVTGVDARPAPHLQHTAGGHSIVSSRSATRHIVDPGPPGCQYRWTIGMIGVMLEATMDGIFD